MNMKMFLTKEEQELSVHLRRSLVHGVSTYLWLQFIAYLMCSFLFFEFLPLTSHMFFAVTLVVLTSLVSLHNKLGRKKKLWSEKRNPLQAVYVTLFYLAIGYIWWGAYIIELLRSNAENVSLLIVIAGIVGAFAISLMGVFQRIFTFVILLTITLVSSVMWVTYGAAGKPYILQILALGLFHYILLRIQNARLFDSLKIKVKNIELVEVLEQKNFELRQANLAQSRYLSAASHDLRQPLHALALIADDIQRKNKDASIDFSLNRMNQAIESLSKSFDAMLNLSRLDAGVIKPNIQNFPIQRLLERLVVEYESTAAQKNLRFTVVKSKVWVRADEGILYSILSNLVSNALRYTEAGGVVVGVRRHKNSCVPIVFDTGVGIPEEKLHHIFQEYHRLDYAQQRNIGGVGLGLSISERMARLLETKLIVRSKVGQGSAFGLTLNCVAMDSSLFLNDNSLNTIGQDYLFGKKAIILDDDDMAVEKLDELLTSWGVDVSIVLSFEMLNELVLEEGEVDLIISDYHLGMAQENGLGILECARSLHHGKTPLCVLITGDTTTELIESAQQSVIHLLHKPVSPVRLRAFLNAQLKDMSIASVETRSDEKKERMLDTA